MVLLWSSSISYAEEFCVSDRYELMQALFIAQSNNQSDVIKIKPGDYLSPANGFRYDGESEDYDLSISGGWVDGIGVGSGTACASQLPHVFITNINGENIHRILWVSIGVNSKLSVKRLSFNKGFLGLDHNELNRGAGLLVRTPPISEASILIENCTFTNNTAYTGAALYVGGLGDGGKLQVVRNNIFTKNSAARGSAINLLQYNGSGIFFTNNTVVNNDSLQIASVAGLQISTTGSPTNNSEAFIANNVIWGNKVGNMISDLGLGLSDTTRYLYNNDIGRMVDFGGTLISDGNVSIPPLLTNAYAPNRNSPLINKGTHPIDAENWQLGTLDIYRNNRVRGGIVDIGAVEISGAIFINGFEVYSLEIIKEQ